MARTPARLTAVLAGSVGLVVLLAACGVAGPGSTEDLRAELHDIPGVVDVTIDGTVESGRVATVTVGEDAPDEVVIAAAREAVEIAGTRNWTGEVDLARELADPFDEAADMPNPTPWFIPVYSNPDDPATGREAADLPTTVAVLEGLLEVERMPDVVAVASEDGWPSVTLSGLDGFDAAFDAISATPLFSAGGTFQLSGDGHRLRVVFVPERTSRAVVHEIIRIAAQHPAAKVLLEATTYEPQWPEFYVSGVTEAEASALQARLSDPAWSTADVDGFALPFVIRNPAPAGPDYLTGTFGGIADDAGQE